MYGLLITTRTVPESGNGTLLHQVPYMRAIPVVCDPDIPWLSPVEVLKKGSLWAKL